MRIERVLHAHAGCRSHTRPDGFCDRR